MRYFLFSMICLFALPAIAQERHDHLTEDNITDFIQRTTEISSGQNSDLSQSEITAYLQAHLHKKVRFKSTMRYNIPGFPSKNSSMSLGKKEYIESLQQGANALSDYETNIEIQDIKFSTDKMKATVFTTSTESGTMPVNGAEGQGSIDIPIDGESSCTQILTLKKGIIQIYNATCTTTISFSGF